MLQVIDGDRQPKAVGSQAAERFADMAYEATRVDPRGEEGVGVVLRRMVRFGGVRFVRGGVTPGRALVEHPGRPLRFGKPVDLPVSVHLLDPSMQTGSQLVLACSRAIARILAWYMGEEWDEAGLESVALALAMPQPVVVLSLNTRSIEEVAGQFHVDVATAAHRARMLRRCHDSGQLHAVRAPDSQR